MARAPLWPRVDVLPRPEPMPRPIRFFRCFWPSGGVRELRFMTISFASCRLLIDGVSGPGSVEKQHAAMSHLVDQREQVRQLLHKAPERGRIRPLDHLIHFPEAKTAHDGLMLFRRADD